MDIHYYYVIVNVGQPPVFTHLFTTLEAAQQAFAAPPEMTYVGTVYVPYKELCSYRSTYGEMTEWTVLARGGGYYHHNVAGGYY